MFNVINESFYILSQQNVSMLTKKLSCKFKGSVNVPFTTIIEKITMGVHSVPRSKYVLLIKLFFPTMVVNV